MVLAFMAGGAARLFEEQLRRRYVRIAVTSPIRGQDADELLQIMSEWSASYSWFMTLCFILSPERTLRSMQQAVAKHREANESCSSPKS